MEEYKEAYDGYKVFKCGRVIGKRGIAMTPSGNGRGYLALSIMVAGKKMTKSLHRLVAEAWIPNPEGLSDVNHKDCDKHNCHMDNLEWMTHGDNIKHAFTNELRSATGENNARCIISEADVIKICQLLEGGFSSAKIRDAGFDYGTVRAIKRRKNWTHISKEFIW